jgi:hypothetical protein
MATGAVNGGEDGTVVLGFGDWVRSHNIKWFVNHGVMLVDVQATLDFFKSESWNKELP